MRNLKAGLLNVQIAENRKELGDAGAEAVVSKIVELTAEKGDISIIFASAPSQNEFLENLRNDKRIPWHQITAFNMDEYVGLDPKAPQGFGQFLKERLYDHVNLKEVHLFNCLAEDPEAECLRMAKLLESYKPDICIYGIGENGHLAFNDPPVADFNDPKTVKIVELDPVCRQQQINDGCFKSLEEVPTHAFTLTIPALLKCPWMFGMVPGKTKISAITNTVQMEVSTACPATVLKTHPQAVLFIDEDSASNL